MGIIKAKSISEIKEEFAECNVDEILNKIEIYKFDGRKGVEKLIDSARKRLEKYEAEEVRLEEMLFFERDCYSKNFNLVAGIDEVGRGPLAGPVVASVVILPKDCKIQGVNDSKKLTEKKRVELDKIIKEKAIAYAIGVIDHKVIDEINILQATYEAMRQALDKIEVKPDFILNDAVVIPYVDIPQRGIVEGDGKSMSIAAASIIAKVYRDNLMVEYSEKYPDYGFESNKGYGAASHIAKIQADGLCEIHRRSFVKNIINKETNNTKGDLGERIAIKQLMKKGYEILTRNYRYGKGEVDIIAKKDDYFCFIEVKYRTSRYAGDPCVAVNKNKQERIIEASQGYLMEKKLQDINIRFDVAEVLVENGETMFRYTENAFIVD